MLGRARKGIRGGRVTVELPVHSRVLLSESGQLGLRLGNTAEMKAPLMRYSHGRGGLVIDHSRLIRGSHSILLFEQLVLDSPSDV